MKSEGQKLALYLITPVEEQLKECCQAQKVLFVFAYIYYSYATLYVEEPYQ